MDAELELESDAEDTALAKRLLLDYLAQDREGRRDDLTILMVCSLKPVWGEDHIVSYISE